MPGGIPGGGGGLPGRPELIKHACDRSEGYEARSFAARVQIPVREPSDELELVVGLSRDRS